MSRLISYPIDAPVQPSNPEVTPEDGSIFSTTGSSLTIEAKTEVIPAEVAEKIIARPTVIASKTHLTATGSWSWEQMRDYVLGEITARWGARPRDPLKESGIFKGFVGRWGDKSEPIARAAFEIYNGIWNGAPVSVERFAKGSDPYFAEVLAKNL